MAIVYNIFLYTADRTVMPEGATPEQGYAILSFTLMLRRKMMFSTYILTMPAVFLAFLTLLVFWLPPEHADKSALGKKTCSNNSSLKIKLVLFDTVNLISVTLRLICEMVTFGNISIFVLKTFYVLSFNSIRFFCLSRFNYIR